MISLPLSTGIKCLAVFVLPLFSSCDDGLTYDENGQVVTAAPFVDTGHQQLLADSISSPDTVVYRPAEVIPPGLDTALINTKATTPDELVAYAETQLGVRYKYASINPKVGFDCSGFITYVFNHFGIKVPRSSVDFTHVGKAIPVKEAKKGDLILFTGTNPKIRVVGHMGIVYSVDGDEIKFIHSSSGKANGVTISPLEGYYEGRFMSIRRIFPQNY
jgi:cell wall-associated NlpC family hydrolase